MSASPEENEVSVPAEESQDNVSATPEVGNVEKLDGDEPAGEAATDNSNGNDEEEEARRGSLGGGAGLEISDDEESVLSEVDEAQFEDFDPENVDIEERPPLDIDDENLKMIGRHKRKRTSGEEDEARSRRKKEGRREKKNRRMRDSDDVEDEGDLERRKERRRARGATPENEEMLDPATRMFWEGRAVEREEMANLIMQVVAEHLTVPWMKP